MSKLKLAIQKNGRLSEKSLKLLEECGIKISNGTRKLKAVSSNFPLEILFLRDDDIPQYVEQGVADIGIIGLNEVLEQKKNINLVQKLGFAQCRLSLAIPKEENYNGIQYFENKKVATSYPEILSNYFQKNNINAQIEKIGGSVEIAPGIGLSDGIFDIISTGSTLLTNGLKEVETVLESEAVLISSQNLSDENLELLKKLLFRINAVKEASESKYILLNAPNENLEKIINLLPGMKSPTVLPLAESGWSSIHSVIKEDKFWDVIENLKKEGAQGILVLEIEKMIL
ncbi:ATP phosphoribosyltransferase [Epilithonimonas vandammei]|uniref:ATP phosphoribosyltransferase n=1 Tax=Epilithonimonas vandammei TaxID=2487072 RepID=UPI0028A1619C|nr:ATP phosphoribosyltransferase [Epilithonimonas vandammei]